MRYIDEQIQGFKVNLKPERKSKFISVVSKIRGLDQVVPILICYSLLCVVSLSRDCQSVHALPTSSLSVYLLGVLAI